MKFDRIAKIENAISQGRNAVLCDEVVGRTPKGVPPLLTHHGIRRNRKRSDLRGLRRLTKMIFGYFGRPIRIQRAIGNESMDGRMRPVASTRRIAVLHWVDVDVVDDWRGRARRG